MKKHFYHHLIQIDSIHISLDLMDLSPEEKQELLDLIEKNLHHAIMDTVLSQLPEEDKKTFLSLVVEEDNNQIWHLLTTKVTNIEEKLKNVVEELKKKIHKDIEDAHKA